MSDFQTVNLGFWRRCAILMAFAICGDWVSKPKAFGQGDGQPFGQGELQGEERQAKPLWSLEAPMDIWIWTGDSPAVFGHLASHFGNVRIAPSSRFEHDDLEKLETLCGQLADARIGPWTSLGLAFTDEGRWQAILLGTTDLSQRQLEEAIV